MSVTLSAKTIAARIAVDVYKKPRRKVTPLRRTSIRFEILKAMDGTKTPEALAERFARSRGQLMSHCFSAYKHNGIGYGLTAKGHLVAILPQGITLEKLAPVAAE